MQAIKNFLLLKIFSFPIILISVDRKNFKQNFDHLPNIFPPYITILFGKIKAGKNKIQTKTTPL